MKRQRPKTPELPWQTRATAALSEFNFARRPAPRMAALRKLQTLVKGDEAVKEVLRKCLALTIRAERLRKCGLIALFP